MFVSMDVIGHLGHNPERRALDNGNALTTFDVAVDMGRDRAPQWIKVTAWGDLGERCSQWLTKGSKVFVRGVPMPRGWQGRDGQWRVQIEVTAQLVRNLTSRQEQEAAAPAAAPAPAEPDPEDPPF